ncbi:MAG TPA: hypothetical protein VD927_02480 [Chryseosolibacter sp.]|nr:hypothetical protein [Chryseosolibacter sp.]
MGTIELKAHIHKIVDKIQDEIFLRSIYDFLKVRENSKAGDLWATLSEEQQREVFLAYEESEDEKNLVPGDQVFKRPS